MKKRLLSFMFVLACALPATGVSLQNFQEAYYITAAGGAGFITRENKHQLKYKTGFILSGAFGYRTKRNIRLEAEYAYRRNQMDSVKSGHIRSNAAFINALYDFPTCYFLKPYAGAGIGYAQNTVSYKMGFPNGNWRAESEKSRIAWQLIAGAAYPITESLDALVEYRYYKPQNMHIIFNNVLFGLRSHF